MDTIHKDRSLLEHADSEMKDYLLSDQLFWPLNNGERLTLGALLLALMRSHALAQTPESIRFNDEIEQKISTLRGKWRTNWSNKAELEFRSRLRQWGLVVREIISKDKQGTVVYSHEVTLRVLLSLLQSEILKTDPANLEQLLILDKQLQAVCHEPGFVWNSLLAPKFPKDKYWFLYCSPITGE